MKFALSVFLTEKKQDIACKTKKDGYIKDRFTQHNSKPEPETAFRR
jgi:hypothetical protein